MKLLVAGLLVAAALHPLPAAAQDAAARQTASSPLIGSWAVDVSRMGVPADQRPRAVTITYGEAGGGAWHMTVDITTLDGRKMGAKSDLRLDGTVTPSTGYPGVDKVAATLPAPNVLVMALYKEGMPRTTRTYVVAPDGQSMTESVFYLNLNGEPGLLTNYFARVK